MRGAGVWSLGANHRVKYVLIVHVALGHCAVRNVRKILLLSLACSGPGRSDADITLSSLCNGHLSEEKGVCSH